MKDTLKDSAGRKRRARAVVRWILGAVFVGAGVLKVAHPVAFQTDLLAYGIAAPDWVFRFIAVVVPWVEIFSGGLLLAGFWPETAGVLVTGMSLVFVLALGQAVVRGLDLQCGCFGAVAAGWFEQPLVALARATLLLGASVWLLRHSGGSDEPASRSL